MRRFVLFLALAACSAPKPKKMEASAPVLTTDAPHEELDVPRPSNEDIGPLVPYMPASAWTGKGVPPKQFSLFTLPDRSPLLGWSALDRDACEAELGKRQIGFTRGEDTAGVRAPIRLTGKLHGVGFHSRIPEPQRAKSKADLIDCRLAIALDEFAKTLAARDIDDVIFLSAYRSNKEGGCTVKYPGEQHCAALAVDVGSFHKKDGKELVVERDFKGKIGTLTCATSPPPNELWDIACHAAGRDFQVILTPNWNQEHRNHFHLELTTHEWMLVR